ETPWSRSQRAGRRVHSQADRGQSWGESAGPVDRAVQDVGLGASEWGAARRRVPWAAARAASGRAHRAAGAAAQKRQARMVAAHTGAGGGGRHAARGSSERAGAGAVASGAPHGRGTARQRARAAAPLPRLQPTGRRASEVSGHRTGAADRVLLLVVGPATPRAA